MSPYGIPPEKGGESPANVSKLEKCVADVMKKGHDKGSAIAICKAQFGFLKPTGLKQ